MSHLDEGLIHALLDGEIPSPELPPIQAHLAACAECRARLAEEQELLAESDRLIEVLEVPALAVAGGTKRGSLPSRRWPRHLAWAATVVLAAGLGYAAGDFQVSKPLPEQVAAQPDSARGALAAPEVPQTREPGSQGAREPENQGIEKRAVPAPPRGPAEERQVARDAAPPAQRERPAATGAAAPPAPVAPEAAPGEKAAASNLAGTRRLGAVSLRLEEQVVTGTTAQADFSKLAAPSPISFPEAVRTLGGTLRLIEGLVPERLEAVNQVVRVIYRTGFGELVLSQELTQGRVRITLIAPPGLPADSLERLRARVRE